MVRVRNKLTARAVATLTTPGKYSDGGSLYLRIDGSETKDEIDRRRWIYRFPWRGRVREMGLGGFPDISLAEARKARDLAQDLVRQGKDPIYAREEARR
ncbi:MAG TPA: Arm DNA-binding domain-containing protein, partial [Roseiarcus sp.]